jgi:hypothetical protein
MPANRLSPYFAPAAAPRGAAVSFVPCPALLAPAAWAMPLYEAAYAAAREAARPRRDAALYSPCWN